MPKVTVIVPVYNVEAYVGKCVDSILRQSFSDFELILVDDGSTDGGGGICDSYAEKDARIRVIHQKNAGLGGARNTGIEAAAGEYLLFVDSDDTVEPETLEKAMGKSESLQADILAFSFRSVDESGNTLSVFHENLPKEKPLSPMRDKQVFLSSPSAWNKLYRRCLFKDTGVRFPPRVWYEDVRTTFKLFLSAKSIVFTDDILYNYLIRQGSIMQNSNVRRNVEIMEAFRDLISYFKESGRYEEFRNELEFLCIDHILISASVRVIKIDKKSPLLHEFRDFLEKNFPAFRENPYLHTLRRNRRIVYRLLLKKRYRLVGLIFAVKSKA